jgi:hypothetical protein
MVSLGRYEQVRKQVNKQARKSANINSALPQCQKQIAMAPHGLKLDGNEAQHLQADCYTPPLSPGQVCFGKKRIAEK